MSDIHLWTSQFSKIGLMLILCPKTKFVRPREACGSPGTHSGLTAKENIFISYLSLHQSWSLTLVSECWRCPQTLATVNCSTSSQELIFCWFLSTLRAAIFVQMIFPTFEEISVLVCFTTVLQSSFQRGFLPYFFSQQTGPETIPVFQYLPKFHTKAYWIELGRIKLKQSFCSQFQTNWDNNCIPSIDSSRSTWSFNARIFKK